MTLSKTAFNNTGSDDNIIQPGARIAVKEEGMPNPKTGDKGDLIVTFSVKFPTAIGSELKALLKDKMMDHPTKKARDEL